MDGIHAKADDFVARHLQVDNLIGLLVPPVVHAERVLAFDEGSFYGRLADCDLFS